MERILRVKPKSILVGVTQSIAGIVKRSERGLLRNHLQQALQIVESDSSARILIEALLNAGAAELTSELQLVLIHLPGKAVKNLIVRIHPLARIAGGGSHLRKEP